MYFCTHCGARVEEENARFCTVCGAPLEKTEPPLPEAAPAAPPAQTGRVQHRTSALLVVLMVLMAVLLAAGAALGVLLLMRQLDLTPAAAAEVSAEAGPQEFEEPEATQPTPTPAPAATAAPTPSPTPSPAPTATPLPTAAPAPAVPPTPIPGTATTPVPAATLPPVVTESEYILPHSDTEAITLEDLQGLSAWEARVARNEILARHGRRFNDPDLQAHFDSCSWYHGTIDADDFDYNVLSALEQQNVEVIKRYEATLG